MFVTERLYTSLIIHFFCFHRPIAHTSRLDPLELELAAADIGTVNWQERCLELQLELHRSRNQATRVRDMLRDKVSDAWYHVPCSETLVAKLALTS